MSKREYRDYLQDISDAVDAIEHFTKGITRDQFIEDLKTVYATRKGHRNYRGSNQKNSQDI